MIAQVTGSCLPFLHYARADEKHHGHYKRLDREYIAQRSAADASDRYLSCRSIIQTSDASDFPRQRAQIGTHQMDTKIQGPKRMYLVSAYPPIHTTLDE